MFDRASDLDLGLWNSGLATNVTFFFWLCWTKFWCVHWILGRSGVATLLVVVVGVVVGTCSSLLQILAKLHGLDSAGLDVGLQWLDVLVSAWPRARTCWHVTLRTLKPPSQVDEHWAYLYRNKIGLDIINWIGRHHLHNRWWALRKNTDHGQMGRKSQLKRIDPSLRQGLRPTEKIRCSSTSF